jgi:hypothetical protein
MLVGHGPHHKKKATELGSTERIADQKFAVRALVILYRNSISIPGRTDTLGDTHEEKINASKIFKFAMRGVKDVATTTTTALGNVAVSPIVILQMCVSSDQTSLRSQERRCYNQTHHRRSYKLHWSL